MFFSLDFLWDCLPHYVLDTVLVCANVYTAISTLIFSDMFLLSTAIAIFNDFFRNFGILFTIITHTYMLAYIER